MKTIVMTLAAALTWLGGAVAMAQWPTATYDTRNWEWESGARIMARPGTQQQLPLVTDAVTNSVLFDAETATDLRVAPGFDLRFLRRNPYGIEWEIQTNMNFWKTSRVFDSPNGLDSPFFQPIRDAIPDQIIVLPPFNVLNVTDVTFNSINYDYDSDLFDLELNARRAVLPGVTLLIGPRFLYLEDRLIVGTNATISGDTDIGPAVLEFTQTNDITTKNPMFGLQLGLDLNVPVSRTVYATGFIKAGGYGTSARSRFVQSDSLQGITNTFDERRSQGTFLGEVGGRLHRDIFPGTFSVYAGYEAQWLDNIAIAPVQLLGAVDGGVNRVEMSGTTFIHGIVFGGTIRR